MHPTASIQNPKSKIQNSRKPTPAYFDKLPLRGRYALAKPCHRLYSTGLPRGEPDIPTLREAAYVRCTRFAFHVACETRLPPFDKLRAAPIHPITPSPHHPITPSPHHPITPSPHLHAQVRGQKSPLIRDFLNHLGGGLASPVTCFGFNADEHRAIAPMGRL